jgi:peptidoglycan hydrolase-like protein with peptidoglycan-binding domain
VGLGLGVGFLLGALAGAFGLAWLNPPVDTAPIDNATRPILVTARVEERPVRELYVLSASITAPTLERLRPTSLGDVARQVVSGKVPAVGDVIHYGDVVGEVSGRPIFAVPGSLPLYRDLRQGDSGSDVVILQTLLTDLGLYSGALDGLLGRSAMNAVAKLYTRAGYAPPDPVGFLMRNTAPVSASGLPVASAAAVGTELSSDQPLATVVASAAVITARVDLLQARAFTVGTVVEVRIGSGAAVESGVLTVGNFQESSSHLPPGYDVTVALPSGVDPEAVKREPVLVSETVEIPTGLAVPLTAIRRDSSGGTYVLLRSASSQASASPPSQAPVTVVGQSSGYAVIQDNPDLPPGAEVVVSGG